MVEFMSNQSISAKIALLEQKRAIIGLVPMAAKPFHNGHLSLIQIAIERCDTVVVFVSKKDRIRPDEVPVYGKTMVLVWKQLIIPNLPENVQVEFVDNPVTAVYEKIETDSNNEQYIIFTGEDDKENYTTKKLSKITAYKNGLVKLYTVDRADTSKTVNISGTKMRSFIKNGDVASFIKYAPSILSVDEKKKYYTLLKSDISTKKESISHFLFNVLNEKTDLSGKLTHLTHLEDLMLINGQHGVEEIKKYLEQVKNILNNKKSNTSISLKWDGSPALVFGINPANKKFFVSTKGAFAKTPKLCYSNEDIKKYFDDKKELAKKLSVALQYLSKINWGGIYQGDYLYTRDDLKMIKFENAKYITFTPNTITYGVLADSKIASNIEASQLGIALHTKYEGDSIEKMIAHPITDSPIQGVHNSVLFVPIVVSLSDIKDSKKITDEIDKIISSTISIPNLSEQVSLMIMTFINDLVRNSKSDVIEKPTQFISTLKQWVRNRAKQQASQVTTKSAKDRKIAQGEQIVSAIDNLNLKPLLQLYNNVKNCKNNIIHILNNTSADTFKTFFNQQGKYVPTTHEGFAISSDSSMAKLVDRDEFSKMNFLMSKNR